MNDDMLVVFVKQLSVGRAVRISIGSVQSPKSDVYGTCIRLSFVILETRIVLAAFGGKSVIGAVVYL